MNNFIHEDYGLFGYEELYRYGEIIVTASKDASMGVLLELKEHGAVGRLPGTRPTGKENRLVSLFEPLYGL
ncbi:MAG: hypothetical protein ACLRZG_07725 [Streptococcus sp.]